MSVSSSPSSSSPLPEGLKLPDMIITRRTRTQSMSGRIQDQVHQGKVKFFCRSKGHGFIDPSKGGSPMFMHISDIEGELIPRKGDTVKFRMCPMPPKFDKFQAVHIEIVDFVPEIHHKWSEKETPEEFEEDRKALEEEARMKEQMSEKVIMDV
ncbi:cold shock domain-containing protein CG9705-like [Tigriopus californicus]|nr:cold shock domain-containing protein CG9705-like [Tigriopus californicus]